MLAHLFRRLYGTVALVLVFAMLFGLLPHQVWANPLTPAQQALAGALLQMHQEQAAVTDLLQTAADMGGVSALPPAGLEALRNGVEPQGMLLDAGALQAAAAGPFAPDSLAQPLTVSRVQSAYRPADALDGAVVITFTVTNHRPPSLLPAIPEGATVTDTATLLSTFDLSADPNTIRNVLLTTSLVENAPFVDAAPLPDRNGDELAFVLGDIAPGSSVTATLTVVVPAAVTDFIPLDAGATAWGTLRARAVSAATAPAMLVSNATGGDWLRWTVDADTRDRYMLEKAAALGQDPIRMFEYVRSLGFESYSGSLRGTRGTLWSEAGSSLDQSSLLIAMLRSSGIPARYVRGDLSVARAQELILSMFPEPAGVIGHVPDDVETSDPANDPALLAETQDHWWVEAFLPDGGWTALDPSFAGAEPGDTFATAGAPLVEVPDALRHKVTMALKVEKTSPLSAAAGAFEIIHPFTVTFDTVELVGNPVTLGHWVDSSGAGPVFTVIEHTYTPYVTLADNDTSIVGNSYQELLTNFPFGSTYVTGIWLTVASLAPDGQTESYERVIKDLIGPAARLNSNQLATLDRGDAAVPLLDLGDLVQLHTVPHSHTPQTEAQRRATTLLAAAPALGEALDDLEALNTDDVVANAEYAYKYADLATGVQMMVLDLLGTSFQVATSSPERSVQSKAMLVHAYPAQPKLLLITQQPVTDTIATSLEFLNNRERALAYPGQSIHAVPGAIFARSIAEKLTEFALLDQTVSGPVTSAAQTILLAVDQDIPLEPIAQSTLASLDFLPLSGQAKAHITAAANGGALIFVPQRPVNIDGVDTIGWLEVDADGYASFVTEEGRPAAVAYGEVAREVTVPPAPSSRMAVEEGAIVKGASKPIVAANQGFTITFWKGLSNLVTAVLGLIGVGIVYAGGGLKAAMLAVLVGAYSRAESTYLDCLSKWFDKTDVLACWAGVAAALAVLAGTLGAVIVGLTLSIANGDPPLPDMLMDVPGPPRLLHTEATTSVVVLASHDSAALTVDLQSGVIQTHNEHDVRWQTAGQLAVQFNQLAAANARLVDRQSQAVLDTGALQSASAGQGLFAGNALHVASSGSGASSLYAPALDGLGAASQWLTYTAVLTSTLPYTLTLANSTVTVDGVEYSGDFIVVVNGATTLQGIGPTAAPNFAPGIDVEMAAGGLMVGPASGTFSVGGQPVNVSNGVAIGGYTGSVSVREASAGTDGVELAGEADFFTVRTTPATSSSDSFSPIAFDAEIEANFDDTYTTTVEAPTGWHVTLDENGAVTATPPAGAGPGDYTLLVTAQSSRHPDLFAAAEHRVTVTAVQAMTLSVTPDPLITVPMGPALSPNARSGDTNDGRVQVPGAAFAIDIGNRSTAAHTFAISVSGLPADSMVLSAGELTLAAGAEGEVGLYVVPPAGTLPPAGTAYNFTVNVAATDGSGLNGSAGGSFTMPALAFNYITASPFRVYAAAGGTAEFDLGVRNVGNAGGNFPVRVELPDDGWSLNGALQSPVAVSPGQVVTQTIQVDVPAVQIGQVFPIRIESPAPGTAYTQTTSVVVQIVSAAAGPWLAAAAGVDRCSDESHTAAALTSLGLGIDELAASCAAGACALALRDRVVDRARSAAFYAGALSPAVTVDEALDALADTLAGRDDDAGIIADLDALGALTAGLETQICEIGEHRVAARFTPAMLAALPGEEANTTLALTNQGRMETTYAVTLTLPGEVQTFELTLAPGAGEDRPLALSVDDLGPYLVRAEVRAVGPDVALPGLGAEATARLSVVDRFVQVLAVRADPPFVETGASSTALAIEVANVANVAQPATARLAVLAPGGGAAWNSEYPLTVLVGDPRPYPLAEVDTSGWAAGVYTVTVELVDGDGQIIPDGRGHGYLGVGQALGVSHGVAPLITAPGTVTATTTITTEIQGETIFPEGARAQRSGAIQALPRTAAPFDATASWGDAARSAFLPQIGAAPSVADQRQTAEEPAARLGPVGGFTRYEEDHADLRYNGQPFTTTTGAWTHTTNLNAAGTSGGGYMSSAAAGDTASLTFNGRWVALGFAANSSSGQVEITIDGASRGMVDLYRTDAAMMSVAYAGLAPGVHTLTLTVLGTRHANASGSAVRLDYIDVWSGSILPDGIFEHDSARVGLSDTWTVVTDTVASAGTYVYNAHPLGVNAWFAFTGDSVSYHGVANPDGGVARLMVDGVLQRTVDFYSPTAISRTVNLDGLGSGVHVLHVQGIRGEIPLDAFQTPAAGPAEPAPAPAGIVRYEEHHPDLRYNGYAFGQRPQSWSWQAPGNTSDTSMVQTSAAGNVASLTFEGRWASAGFYTRSGGGEAEIFVDGESRAVVDLDSAGTDVTSVQVGDLITGTHTISVAVAAGTIYLDYIDIWDGTELPDEITNVQRRAASDRLYFSSGLVDDFSENAIEGDFVRTRLLNNNANVWYTFTGDRFTFYGFSRQNGSRVDVYLDGELIDTADLESPFSLQPLAFHYGGFEEGPHVVRVHNVTNLRIDAFAADVEAPTAYQPIVEWYDNTLAGGSIWGGIHVPIVAGDVNADGHVDLVVASSDIDNNGTLALYRGDGADTGDGDPIQWSIPLNIPNGFEDVGSPAIADLDGQPGAEIVHPSVLGIHVYHSDGSLYWYTDTLKSQVFFATPAIGNLDLEPGPEIVVNMDKTLAVFEADGALAWQTVMAPGVTMPVLADLTGDGLLDILVHDWEETLTLFDYNLGDPQIVFTRTFTSALHGYGSPAIADIDGQLPGGDPGPEIAIASEGLLTVLNADGSLVWERALDPGRSGGVSIADLDGDGEIELVTTMQYDGGRIYALNADGSPLWQTPAPDNSPLQASVVDLDNDGVYDVAWNGAEQGFTIFSGRDGSVLFNEPLVVSQTGTDYPVIADVDGDGYLEMVAAAQGGVRVLGFDGVWGPARPVWNQHSYHITNINDDLTVPGSEWNSWEVHNTYHTQTPLRNPVPSFDVAATHTVAISGVAVIDGTLSHPPTGGAHPVYSWTYTQPGTMPLVNRSLQIEVSDLRPGETRRVAEGTVVRYSLPSGINELALPPLYVAARHIIAMTPAAQTTYGGETLSYEVALANPAAAADVYTLTVAGLPAGWVQELPQTVALAADAEARVTLTVAVPAGTAAESYRFSVLAANRNGGEDQVEGAVEVLSPGFTLALEPAAATVAVDEAAAYTLTLANLTTAAETYTFTVEGTEVHLDGLPISTTVGGGAQTAIPLTAMAAAEGPHAFAIRATAGESGATGRVDGVLTVEGERGVRATLSTARHAGGRGSTVLFALAVTNTGTLSDTYNMRAGLPAGWSAQVLANGAAVDSVSLSPHIFNAADLTLVVRPAADATPGTYPISLTVTSQANPAAAALAPAELEILAAGVRVAILGGGGVGHDSAGTFPVQVTNTGAAADTFSLSASGPLATAASFAANSVTLGPGQSQQVDLQVGPAPGALPGSYLLGVTARSAADSRVFDFAETGIDLGGYGAVEVAWQPAGPVESEQRRTTLFVEIANNGNRDGFFDLAFAAPGLMVERALDEIYLPATMVAIVEVVVRAEESGNYTLTATAKERAGGSEDSATTDLVVTLDEPPAQTGKIYTPLIFGSGGGGSPVEDQRIYLPITHD